MQRLVLFLGELQNASQIIILRHIENMESKIFLSKRWVFLPNVCQLSSRKNDVGSRENFLPKKTKNSKNAKIAKNAEDAKNSKNGKNSRNATNAKECQESKECKECQNAKNALNAKMQRVQKMQRLP